MTNRFAIYTAFALSGIAGLVYEVLWSRYLGLYVGHSAYAQVLVLAVYLGGMAVGAATVGEHSRRVASPLRWYAAIEAALAVLGALFHVVFLLVVDVSYEHLFPAVGSAGAVGAVRWGLSGLILLPPALLLGATFPLMAAGLVRADSRRPGRGVATAYLFNTFGGAAGVLLAGFWLIGTFGLAGTALAAAALNACAAALAWLAAPRVAPAPAGSAGEPHEAPGARSGGEDAADALAAPGGVDEAPDEVAGAAHPASEREGEPVAGVDEGSAAHIPEATSAAAWTPSWTTSPRSLLGVMLVVSFGTALASFAYEIGWIRMLSLVLGSATHAFELMLSAFILGLGLGAWLIRGGVDRTADPTRLLGGVQVLMGLTALATLPVYLATFPVMAGLVEGYEATPSGHLIFNLQRYALSLVVMLPATVLAGMTLPLITGSLLRAGAGESSIGRVYGTNTIGSVTGAALAGLVALPALGLKGLILAGAVLDMALGVWLLALSARSTRGRAVAWLTAGAALAVTLTVGLQLELSRHALTSGVYRYGRVPEPDEWDLLFYEEGRTATISAHVNVDDGLLVISTNGKPDASMGPRWYVEGRDSLPVMAVEPAQDFMTQVMAPLVGLGLRPGARTIANIGHGSGMTGTTLLAAPDLRRLVNIEIEPQMVAGSFVFLPANAPVFSDPRSTFAFDDAKSFFAYTRERFDIIFAEPSNPWVSGVASLFTHEFYARVRDFLTEDGILVQWIQMYELDDDLLLSVIGALDAEFDAYRGYLVGDADLAIVAANGPRLPEPDWTVLDSEAVRSIMLGAPGVTAEHMVALEVFDERTFRAVLDRGVAVNSDFAPVLDLGAERARLRGGMADGMYSLVANRLDLRRLLAEERRPPLPYRLPPSRGLRPLVDWGRAAWMREALAAGGAAPPIQFLAWSESLINVRNFLLEIGDPPLVRDWVDFANAFERVERELNWGTTGWVNESFYRAVYDYLDRLDAPPEPRAVVDLQHALAGFEWERAADAADLVVARVATGERWVRPTVLLDAAVVAYLKAGRPASARYAFELLAPRSERTASNLRNRLLRTLIEDAAAAR